MSFEEATVISVNIAMVVANDLGSTHSRSLPTFNFFTTTDVCIRSQFRFDSITRIWKETSNYRNCPLLVLTDVLTNAEWNSFADNFD